MGTALFLSGRAIIVVVLLAACTVGFTGHTTAAATADQDAGEQVHGIFLGRSPGVQPLDFVNYMAELKGISDKNAVKYALKQVEMLEYSKRKIGQLSGGMKRRVGIAQALVGDPQILIVDEPTAGLDPEERVRFRGVLSRFAKDGKTVLLSTHIVEDVYQICEELAVLRKGHLFYSGTPDALMSHVAGKVKILRLDREEQLLDLQKESIVLSTTYESNGLIARIMDEPLTGQSSWTNRGRFTNK